MPAAYDILWTVLFPVSVAAIVFAIRAFIRKRRAAN